MQVPSYTKPPPPTNHCNVHTQNGLVPCQHLMASNQKCCSASERNPAPTLMAIARPCFRAILVRMQVLLLLFAASRSFERAL